NFERMPLDARISVTGQGRIDGFRIVPASVPPPEAPAEAEGVRELEVTVAGDLPGLLTLPTGDGPFPAVVLVHGSGPNDRDETVGPNRPFLDLARGLAAAGVAVLRYDKRTRVEPDAFRDRAYSARDEVIDDVLAGLALLRARDDVDSDRLFVLGHSLGGLLGPRIAIEAGDLRGLVLLAAPARPLDDLVVEQVEYIAGLDGEIDPQERGQIDALRSASKRIDDLDDADSAAPAMLGLPESYWVDLNAHDPVAGARAFLESGETVLMIAQGGRDYQVTEAGDYSRWSTALNDHPRVLLRLYPDLNHLFIAGEGMATPQEYLRDAGRVHRDVIRDIARFIQQPPA
ncbi:MAG: alpha/beta hydrolase family protein, partial [Wenzhouxiangellaceae bacterium]